MPLQVPVNDVGTWPRPLADIGSILPISFVLATKQSACTVECGEGDVEEREGAAVGVGIGKEKCSRQARQRKSKVAGDQKEKEEKKKGANNGQSHNDTPYSVDWLRRKTSNLY